MFIIAKTNVLELYEDVVTYIFYNIQYIIMNLDNAT